MSSPRMPGPRDLDDAGLEAALRGLVPAIDWPAAMPAGGAPDLATRVRVRLQDRAGAPVRSRWPWQRRDAARARLRGAALLALLAMLALAAVAGAVGLGLPGIRILLGEPPASPSPTSGVSPSGAPGSRLGLGQLVTLDAARDQTGRPLPVPDEPALGPPDAVYVDPAHADQVALVWAERPDLPASLDPGVGLILMSFDGRLHPSFATKVIGSGTALERVRVDGDPGFWISGSPHFFFYESADSTFIEDSRRWIGDALIWSDGTTTWRLESALGRDAAVRIATSLP